jgi:hypothetical protein
VVVQPGSADPDGSPPAPPARRRNWRRGALGAGLLLALCGLYPATAGLVGQIRPRHFTVAQQRQIESWEIAGRWRTLPEGRIFPASVPYTLPGATFDVATGLPLTARRLGVARPAGCARGAGSAVGRILAHYGCTELLRATYADASGSIIATVGVAVLPDTRAAAAAEERLASAAHGGQPRAVRPAPVSGTLAAHFDAAQRQLSWNTPAGPYVILTTAGYADGRPRVRVAADSYLKSEMSSLDGGLEGAVAGVLSTAPPAPTCPGAPGC